MSAGDQSYVWQHCSHPRCHRAPTRHSGVVRPSIPRARVRQQLLGETDGEAGDGRALHRSLLWTVVSVRHGHPRAHRSVLIMVPKTRRIGAALLATIMLGALTAHLFILHVPPTTPGVLFLMSGFVVWGRR